MCVFLADYLIAADTGRGDRLLVEDMAGLKLTSYGIIFSCLVDI